MGSNITERNIALAWLAAKFLLQNETPHAKSQEKNSQQV